MKNFTVANLQSLYKTTNNPSKKSRHLSSIWLDKKEKVLCFSMYESQGLFEGKCLMGTIYLSFTGNVLKVDARRYDQSDATFKKLEDKILGSTIDLSSFKNSWEFVVTDSPDSLRRREVVGQISKETGKVSFYKKENLAKLLEFKTTYKTNNKKGWDYYGGYENTKVFMDLVKKYSDKITQYGITENSGTDYTVSFKLGSVEIYLELSQFFNYSLSAYISHKVNGRVKLTETDIDQFDQVVKELRSGKLSNTTKARVAAGGLGKNTSFSVVNDDQVECTTRFDSYHFTKAPKGVYRFLIDFNKKTVSVNESRSTKFIPEKVKKLQERLFSN